MRAALLLLALAACAKKPPAPPPHVCPGLRDNQGIAACETACAAGDAHACGIAGQLHQEEDDEAVADTNAAPLLVKACDGGDGEGCFWLGAYYRNGLGGLAKDTAKEAATYARALVLLEQACDRGERVPCHLAGGLQTDEAKAQALYRKGCDLGLPGSCERVKK